MHYYKFNIADWSLGTSHLSLEEEAIYFRLINHYYDTETPIPLETQSVFRRLRFGSHSDIALSILNEFFKKTEKGFVHVRCEEILKEYRKTVGKNKRNGAKGGRPRKDAASSQLEEKPSGLSVRTQDKPKHNPNQEPLTINHKPLTILKESNQKAKRFAPNICMWDQWGWPCKPDEEIFNAWMAMRKKTKATISELSFKKIGKDLCKSVSDGFTLDDCLSECECRGWKGFKSEWMENTRSNNEYNKRFNGNKIDAGARLVSKVFGTSEQTEEIGDGIGRIIDT